MAIPRIKETNEANFIKHFLIKTIILWTFLWKRNKQQSEHYTFIYWPTLYIPICLKWDNDQIIIIKKKCKHAWHVSAMFNHMKNKQVDAVFFFLILIQ